MNMDSSATNQSLQQIDVRAYLRPLWARKFIVLAIIIAAGVGTYFVSASKTKQYTTGTSLYIQSATPTVSSSLTAAYPQAAITSAELGDIAQLVTASSVQAAVATQLGPVAAGGRVAAAPSATSDFVTITATSSSPTLAARLANAYASQYLVSRKTSLVNQVHAALSAARRSLALLPKRSSNVADLAERESIVAEIQGYEQTLLDPSIGATQPVLAAVPLTPSSPKPVTDTIFGVVLGAVLAVLLVYVLELLNSKLRSASDLEAAFGHPVVAVLPRVTEPSPFDGEVPNVPREFTEALRMLRFQLRLNPSIRDPKVVVVTSGVQNEGKSTLVRDFALTYAHAGQRVLVVDGDVRNQTLAKLFGVTPQLSLVDRLIDDTPLEDVITPVTLGRTDQGRKLDRAAVLDLLVFGAVGFEGVNMLASPQMREFVEEAAESYDLVLIDTAPILVVADGTPLLALADAVLVVARLGLVTRQNARRLTATVEGIGGRLLGVVANGDESRDQSGYGYGYGYGEGPKPKSGKRQVVNKA